MIFSVNIDHIATIRNARKSKYPSLTRACKIIKDAGAEVVTVHLREDRRHINDFDAKEICNSKILPVNLEIAPTDEMLNIALSLKPKFVCFVPENRQEITTEGGLNIAFHKAKLIQYIKILQENNIEVSLFVDPELEMINQARDVNANTIEIHTGKFAESSLNEDLNNIKEVAKFANSVDLNVHAGHGLTFDSAPKVAKVKHISALHIGHFIITESIFLGLFDATQQMYNLIK